MIQETHSNSLNTGSMNVQNFSIEVNSSMFQMLTSKVYNDTILAVIREWSTNGVDACKAAKGPINYQVHLPTMEESYFSVRDHGIGLDKEDIVGLFCTLGASTKRNSNEFNGAFGIGRMAGLAYSTSFTIESYKDGRYYSYMITVEDGTPKAIELADTTTTEANGLKLTVNVDPSDVRYFTEKAQALYKYFEFKPILNINLDLSTKTAIDIAPDWFMDDSVPSRYDNYVLMSDVIYQIPRVSAFNNKDFTKLVLRVPTGAVSINPGRESLSMDKKTVDYLNERVKDVAQTFTLHTFNTINDIEKPIDKIVAFSTATDTVPYTIRSELVTMITPLLSNYLSVNRGYPNFSAKSPHIEFKVKTPYYKILRAQNEISNLGNLRNIVYIITDQKTGWKNAIDIITQRTTNKYALVLTRPQSEDFDIFLAKAVEWLDEFGVETYYRTSEYSTEAVKTEHAVRTGIYACDIYNSAIYSPTQRADDDTRYLYIKTSGTSSEEEVPTDVISNAFRLLKDNQLLPDDMKHAALVGIPKKYQPLAAQNPKYTYAIDYFKELLKDVEVPIIASVQQANGISVRHKAKLKATTPIPEDLRTYFTELDEYNAWTQGKTLKDTVTVKALAEWFNVKPVSFNFTHPGADVLSRKYKLLQTMAHTYESSEFLYYLKMEHMINEAKLRDNGTEHNSSPAE